jgi:diaminohydroxyphosphoribosylaminopyrimidine deaminase/5-amino-6-(5-phosphoribosylamino)uracil reductase
MQDEQYMRRAIQLAYHGSGNVAPNPTVGAVLVHKGRIIGEGWHAIYGDIHAEVACLRNVSEEDRGLIPESTMYVTLEPCAHQGKQPPCSLRLIDEKVARVVIAAEDPFPQVAGRGINMLRQAGVQVDVGCCRLEARWMNRRFLTAQQKSRPYIVLKWAQSADGYFAPSDGSRRQLSNHYSQTLVHKWRTEESAIMVGYNTALADNPQLNVRFWQGHQPLRIVLDRNRNLPEAHHLLDETIETWIVNEQNESSDGKTSWISLPFNAQLLPVLLQRLLAANKTSLFVEGGAHLLNSFISARLWDEARVLSTDVSLGDGIAAPLLKDSRQACQTFVGGNTLHLVQPGTTEYPYPSGAIF